MADENETDVDTDIETDVEADEQDTDSGEDGGQDEKRQDTGRKEKQVETDKVIPQAEVDRIVAERLTRERKKFADYEDLKKKALEFDKLKDSEKTEIEKLNEQIAEREIELQGFRVAEIRRKAAATAGLDMELAEFITAVDEDEAVEQAKRLLSRIAPKTDDTSSRKLDLKQGARKTAPKEVSRDELIRHMAGFGP